MVKSKEEPDILGTKKEEKENMRAGTASRNGVSFVVTDTREAISL